MSDIYDDNKEGGAMTDDLNALLDSLTNGEHIKATWKRAEHEIAIEGPVYVDGTYCECHKALRWSDRTIEPSLTSIEVTRTEEVTVTRDDEAALHTLLVSLVGGEKVTAEWRNESGTMILTGTATLDAHGLLVRGAVSFLLRHVDGRPYRTLHSVTVRRTLVKRWERDGDE